MKIEKLRVNHIEKPIGYLINRPVISWVVSESTGKKQKSARVVAALDRNFDNVIYDTGERSDLSSVCTVLPIELQPGTRYYFSVKVTADDGDSGESCSFFETGKLSERFEGKWISAPFDEHSIIEKSISIDKPVKSARLYICGLGLYEAYLNSEKIGDEFLSPGYDSYQYNIQYQTYDITDSLRNGKNDFSVWLGNGWYKGRFVLFEQEENIYGDKLQLLCEIRLEYDDETSEVISTDDTWQCRKSPVTFSGIYDGEVYDANLENENKPEKAVVTTAPEGTLIERLGPPVREKCVFSDFEIIHTPKDELVLDFKQNMSGFVSFVSSLEKGRNVRLQYGEILQDGCFYRENLRTAKAEYVFTSNGNKELVRPRFTFYGFRYVKVTGMTREEIMSSSFKAHVLYSDIETTGFIKTSNEKINRLIENALWSQKGNFVDVPTDCPQRDERLGWTGDAMAFARTAMYNMYCPAFFHKYLFDMRSEQRAFGGSVPFVVPNSLQRKTDVHGLDSNKYGQNCWNGSSAWGDAATVIAFNNYLYYGDKALLEEQYENMKMWVDYIRSEDKTKCGDTHIWSSGFHFGDWLSLDGIDRNSDTGKKYLHFVATAFYYMSCVLTAKAAKIIGKNDDEKYYFSLSEKIKKAFCEKFINSDSTLAFNTQTAHVLALSFDLAPVDSREKIAQNLRKLILEKDSHLDTGFVGTYLLCPALSENGMSDLAYTLLLNEDFPSWLYEVNLGATTIWERWDSVLPDGKISSTGMNSMNHYCYGAIVQWMYQNMIGLKAAEAGFKKVEIKPEIDSRLSFANCVYQSAAGVYKIGWKLDGGKAFYNIAVPFDCEAAVTLPQGQKMTLSAGEYEFETEIGEKRNLYGNLPRSFKTEEFFSPQIELAPIYSWVFNGKLSHEETDKQLAEMNRLGIKAMYVIPEPKEFRPDTMPTELEPGYLTEEYFEEYIYALKQAEKLGMICWLYDEGGWPSGSACGKVVAQYPETRMQGVRIRNFPVNEGETYKVQNPDTLASFIEKTQFITEGYVFEYDTTVSEYYRVFEETTEPDVTKQGVTERFIEITHDQYKKAMGDEFHDLVKAVFTDEPGAPFLTPELFDEFEKENGFSVLPFLPYIGFVAEPTQQAADVMEKWFDLCSRKFCENYLCKLKRWCEDNGTLSTGHVNVDDTLDGWRIGRHFNVMRALRCFDIPGVDVIWRQIFPGKQRTNEIGMSIAENRLFPRYASSAAAQNGTKYVMSESFGVYGAGTTYDEMRFTAGFQTIRGVNIINPMVVSYLRKAAVLAQEQPIFVEDFACCKLLDGFNSYLQRLCYVCSLGKRVCNTALYYPIHNFYRRQNAEKVTKEYESIGKALDEKRIDFDIIDDDAIISADGIDEGNIRVGNARYKNVLFPEHAIVPDGIKSHLDEYVANGLTVAFSTEDLPKVLPEIGEKNIRLMRRELENGKLFIFFNEGDETAEFELPYFDSNIYNACLENGKLYKCREKERLSLVCGETAVILVTDEEFEAFENNTEFEKEMALTDFELTKKTACILTDERLITEDHPDEKQAAKLGDWSEYVGKKYSGSCVYKTEFSFEKMPDGDALLDLGKVCYACEIKLNAKEVCKKLTSPFKCVLPKEYLQKDNILEITVYNTMANEFVYTDLFDKYEIGQLSPYFEKEMVFMKDALESGLFGPVKIKYND